jgi:RNA polymerase sigma factor (sigma-70 family)
MGPRDRRLSDQDIAELLVVARRFASRWCRSPADAEDVAQEAVVRLLGQRSFPSNVRAWLFVVIRRLAGRLRVREVTRLRAESFFLAHRRCALSDVVLHVEVARVLTSLSHRDSRLLLRVLEGVRSAEIAREFGCHTRDIGQMVARARLKARQAAGRDAAALRPVRKRQRRGS